MSQATYVGTGHRKNSIARVRLTLGSGKILINGINAELYLQFSPNYLQVSKSPLSSLGLENKYDLIIKTEGGGLTGQTEAIRLGLARALCKINPENRVALKFEGYLTRDSRSKERKKYGLRKARKAPQFSKR
jgi:small subunit ribosomal protein S9